MIRQTFIIDLKEKDKAKIYQNPDSHKVSARCMVRQDLKEKNPWTVISHKTVWLVKK